MLETVRGPALGRLRAAGEEHELRTRHVEWYSSFVEQADDELGGPRQLEVVGLVEREFGNIRAAFTWSLECGDIDAALGFLAAPRFWRFLQGHGAEGLAWAA